MNWQLFTAFLLITTVLILLPRPIVRLRWFPGLTGTQEDDTLSWALGDGLAHRMRAT
jgi:hypothetical protein